MTYDGIGTGTGEAPRRTSTAPGLAAGPERRGNALRRGAALHCEKQLCTAVPFHPCGAPYRIYYSPAPHRTVNALFGLALISGTRRSC
ncbi:unnamed protein product [Arctia plantaginis]|uniref:Uncharacterized protein n=1 Tax=Arctia plantaginis TaxID=874455 RepID=A0A8S0ZP33_ARCPL|nr:unnamed protein product [Arctia plantaginis]